MPQDDEDIALLKDCLGGNPGAWEAFVRRFAPYLSEVCRRTLRRCRRPSGSQEVADMLQAVFLGFLADDRRVLRAYAGRGTVAGYLITVAVHCVLDDRSLPASPDSPAGAPGDPLDPAPTPAEALEAQEARELLHHGLEALPPRSRLALTLQVDGFPIQDIGDALGISGDAAAQILSRARAALRARLQPPGA